MNAIPNFYENCARLPLRRWRGTSQGYKRCSPGKGFLPYRTSYTLSLIYVFSLISEAVILFLKWDFWDFFFLCTRYSILLHLPPLRFHCVGGCWDLTQDICDYSIGCQTLDLFHIRQNLIHYSARFHPPLVILLILNCTQVETRLYRSASPPL